MQLPFWDSCYPFSAHTTYVWFKLLHDSEVSWSQWTRICMGFLHPFERKLRISHYILTHWSDPDLMDCPSDRWPTSRHVPRRSLCCDWAPWTSARSTWSLDDRCGVGRSILVGQSGRSPGLVEGHCPSVPLGWSPRKQRLHGNMYIHMYIYI